MSTLELSTAQCSDLLSQIDVDPRQKREFLRDTDRLVGTFKEFRALKTRNSADVRKILRSIDNHAEQVLRLSCDVIWGNPEKQTGAQYVARTSIARYCRIEAQVFSDALHYLQIAARRAQEDWQPKGRGARKDAVAIWFTNALKEVYETHTGRLAGKSRKGPFTRYVCLCLRIAGENRVDAGELVLRALEKRPDRRTQRMRREDSHPLRFPHRARNVRNKIGGPIA